MDVLKERRVEVKDGQPYYVLIKSGERIYMSIDDVHAAESKGISWSEILDRILWKNQSVNQALGKHGPYEDTKTREEITLEMLHKQEVEREIRLYNRRKESERKKKPHLFNVKQKHTRSKYLQGLMDNNAIAKLKTDCYGRVQRG